MPATPMRALRRAPLAALLGVAALCGSAAALYGGSSKVVVSTAGDFPDVVMASKGPVVVEFFAPWCGHCKNLKPEYDKAAAALEGIAKVVAVDATAEQSLASEYGVQGFPTIKMFGADKTKPTDYQGGRTAQAIVDAVMREARSIARHRLGGGGAAGGAGGGRRAGSGSFTGGSSDVVKLTDGTFEETVMESKDMWLVEFFAPWCGHCKALAPEWEKAATQLKGKVKVAAVDATAETSLATQFGVRGYPTIKWFAYGDKGEAQDYQGPREAAGITSFALQELAKSGWEPDVDEITSNKEFKDLCGDAQICAVAFLPQLFDDGKAGREENIALLKKVAGRVSGASFAFGWISAGQQTAFEESFDLRAGFPTMVVLNYKKKAASVFTAAWSQDKLVSFVNMMGRSRGSRRLKIDKWVKLQTTEKWNGEDAEVIEEEFSLADIMGDDL